MEKNLLRDASASAALITSYPEVVKVAKEIWK
jgi:hypothetical protein